MIAPARPATDDELLVDAMNDMGLKCPFCTYDLRAAVGIICPECGKRLTWKDFQDDRQMPGGWFVVLAILGATGWLVVTGMGLLFLALTFAAVVVGPIILLLDLAAFCFSGWMLLSWSARPRRLLRVSHGARLLVWTIAVPMGVVVMLSGPAMVCAFVYAAAT